MQFTRSLWLLTSLAAYVAAADTTAANSVLAALTTDTSTLDTATLTSSARYLLFGAPSMIVVKAHISAA